MRRAAKSLLALLLCLVLLCRGPLLISAADSSVTLIQVPWVSQVKDFPNGCEPISALMALWYYGILIPPGTFVEQYLDMGRTPVRNGLGPDPAKEFAGDPRSIYGWGCWAPCIVKTLRRVVDPAVYTVSNTTGLSLDLLCENYVANGIPVVIWVTLNMANASAESCYAQWQTAAGKTIRYNTYQHCVLLVGYDEDNYYVNDPLTQSVGSHLNPTAYPKNEVKRAYHIMGRQSVALYRDALAASRASQEPGTAAKADGSSVALLRLSVADRLRQLGGALRRCVVREAARLGSE